MLIWRVQNTRGLGPYYGACSSTWVDSMEKHGNSSICPCPYEDTLLSKFWNGMAFSDQNQYLFGFSSQFQLEQWFSPSELEKLKGQGYYVTTLEIPDEDVVVGAKQVVFKKNCDKVAPI